MSKVLWWKAPTGYDSIPASWHTFFQGTRVTISEHSDGYFFGWDIHTTDAKVIKWLKARLKKEDERDHIYTYLRKKEHVFKWRHPELRVVDEGYIRCELSYTRIGSAKRAVLRFLRKHFKHLKPSFSLERISNSNWQKGFTLSGEPSLMLSIKASEFLKRLDWALIRMSDHPNVTLNYHVHYGSPRSYTTWHSALSRIYREANTQRYLWKRGMADLTLGRLVPNHL